MSADLSGWTAVLDRLDEATDLLVSADPDWMPVGLGPLPRELVDRVCATLARQRSTIFRLDEQLASAGRELASLVVRGPGSVQARAMYLDVTG